MPKKHILDFEVTEVQRIGDIYALLTLAPCGGRELPEIAPGQFTQVRIDNRDTFLRRPISICSVCDGHLQLLVRNAGEGSLWLISRQPGDIVNLLLPLGNHFKIPTEKPDKPMLLVAGGVGVAPMAALGSVLKRMGYPLRTLVGARNADGVLLRESLEQFGTLMVTTEDGSEGERGLVTASTAWEDDYSRVYVCGPAPMMKAVARICRRKGIPCEVSLENMMACGLGACLCCVEKTVRGNVCVCTEGPVFDINELTWN
ncbi:MAG: dihydroorotate dehydrogenase electron transfer subunit [Candidatus Amulumruptor caecigallinarius]|nr:dihydroorotate dehydrogenase electron transfer subunit [Candidatus Amulumruptor caecigallinarius]MCM1396834.1 dihydroorotate dehydrogenase electron transfer subunit [Candidatus Amulumruptor caecigallinarius]MCM1454222.1 dihydroorotate dehydrogenase electron transfer subunit [bacterium]